LISGTPTQGGTFYVQLTATNSAGSDTKQLILTITSLPSTCAVSASTTSILSGQSVIITATATSRYGTLQYLHIDQLSPQSGCYGAGDTGTEIPPNNYYPTPLGNSYTRQLTLTLSAPGTYVFRAAAYEGYGWYYSPNTVTVTVGSTNYTLTVQNG